MRVQLDRGNGYEILARDDLAERLRRVECQIRGFGVRRLALFGSVQRGEARPDSDVDLLVEFAPGEKTAAEANYLVEQRHSLGRERFIDEPNMTDLGWQLGRSS